MLLVEDQTSVRNVAARILRRHGLTVMEAGSASEALTLARRHDGDIDLLITDVVMPGGAAAEVARSLAEERPGMRVLFMSGCAAGGLERHGVAPDANILRKPFTPRSLAARVTASLAAPA